MGKFGHLAYNSSLRMFVFFRRKYFNFGSNIVPARIYVSASYGCSLPICIYDGFCKDCLYKICDQVSY